MKVKCALYVEIEREEELAALDWAALPQPVMVMGGGSNLLFTKDFPGTVLHIGIRSTFGPGLILEEGPSPLNVAHNSLKGQNAGPGPCDKNRPGPKLVAVGAGTVFDDFCAWAAAESLWGPENLSLIPGECGASAVQNIGAYGVEAKDIIHSIRAYDRVSGTFVCIDPEDCEYGYRTSRFKTQWKGRYIITAVTYKLSKDPQPKLDYGGLRKALAERGVEAYSPTASASLRPLPQPAAAGPSLLSGRGWPEVGEHASTPLTPQIIRNVIIDIRNSKLPDPKVTGSAGSFFCNPVISKEHFERIKAIAREDNGPDYQVPHYEVGDQIKVPAAWMIEQCGFKGRKLGGAQVYQNQPLVIVNASGDATPEEIIGLEQQVIQTIEKKYGITLHPEVEHI